MKERGEAQEDEQGETINIIEILQLLRRNNIAEVIIAFKYFFLIIEACFILYNIYIAHDA